MTSDSKDTHILSPSHDIGVIGLSGGSGCVDCADIAGGSAVIKLGVEGGSGGGCVCGGQKDRAKAQRHSVLSLVWECAGRFNRVRDVRPGRRSRGLGGGSSVSGYKNPTEEEPQVAWEKKGKPGFSCDACGLVGGPGSGWLVVTVRQQRSVGAQQRNSGCGRTQRRRAGVGDG